MSAPYSDIETKLELALKGHINTFASQLAGITIHAGLDNANLDAPSVVCLCEPAQEHPPFSGNYTCDAQIQITSMGDDTSPSTHRNTVAVIRDNFSCDWIGASLNAQGIANFSVVGVVSQKSSRATQDRHWETILPFQIFCRPS